MSDVPSDAAGTTPDDSLPHPRRDSCRDPAALVRAGLVAPAGLAALEAVAARYAVAVTPDMADLIDPGDPADPIARQFMPRAEELETRPEEEPDPIGDAAHSPLPGLVHRYPDRVLLKPLHVCPVYCRFCFRREMVGPDGHGTLSEADLDRAFAYVAERPGIWEVVVTGGDPFALSPRRLGRIAAALAAIPHVRVLRFHTRVPVVEPARVGAELVAALKHFDGAVFVALHANHPREFTPAAMAAMARLVDAGIPLVSQTVLLAGVNDDPDTLSLLMRRFVENRVKPYYLHHGDLAPGTAHLRTGLAQGRNLVRALRGRLSGLAQPLYVLDIPGGHGKVPAGPDYLEATGTGWRVADPRGGVHAYPPDVGAAPAAAAEGDALTGLRPRASDAPAPSHGDPAGSGSAAANATGKRMGVFQDFVGRFSQTVTAFIGDRALMEAAVSAAANVILADYEIDEEEIEAALAGMRANPILERGYDTLKLEAELFEGIARARTRVGRAENIGYVTAIAEREIAQRTSVFLIAADVADQAGISDLEHVALAEIATALGVDKDALLGSAAKA